MTAKEARDLMSSKRGDRERIVLDFIASKIKEQAENGYSMCYLELPTSFKNEIETFLDAGRYDFYFMESEKNPMYTNFTIAWDNEQENV